MTEMVIQRIVCRADLNYDMAEILIKVFKEAIVELDKAVVLVHGKEKPIKVYGFTH